MPIFADLKQVIARSGMSYEAIAEKAECHPNTIGMWLDGKTKEPHLGTLMRVAKVFGKTIELSDGQLVMADTPATVAAKMQTARAHLSLWRRYQ